MSDFKKLAEDSGASQDWFEMYQMLMVMNQVVPKKNGVIVEIGVDGGGGLATYSYAFPHARVIGIDNNMEKVDQLKDFEMIFGDTTKPETLKQLVDMLDGQLIDFLFIDGDHVYDGVKNDWEVFKHLVRSGGAIGFHDTSRQGEGWATKVEVRTFLRELWKSNSHPWAEFWNGRENPGTAIVWV